MAAISTSVDQTTSPDVPVKVRRRHPAQKLMLVAAAGVIFGSFLPWVQTSVETFTGFSGAGVYTFYAGVLGIAAGMVPARIPAMIQGSVMAAAAIGLPLWQILHLYTKVGFEGWMPGMGLLMVMGAGLFAIRSVWQMYKNPA